MRAEQASNIAPPCNLAELFLGFLSIGARSYGGVMPVAYRVLVEERRWISPGAASVEVLHEHLEASGPAILPSAARRRRDAFGLSVSVGSSLRLRSPQRSSGGISLIGAENEACAAASTGRWRTFVLAGSLPRKLSPFQLRAGLIGRGTKPPPQLEQTLPRTPSTHSAQNVHSYVQIRASNEFGGRGRLQCSQVGRSSSIVSEVTATALARR